MEYVVSFKDLFICVFNLKKSELEKDIQKRDIDNNIKMKKIEIIESVAHMAIQNESTSKVCM